MDDVMDVYHEIILDHYRNPRNQGWIKDVVSDESLHQVPIGNASCGDMFEISLRAKNGVITEVKWRGQGCAVSTASLSLVSEWLPGKTVEDAKKLDKQQILHLMGMTSVSSARESCLFLPLRLLAHL
jgi:nitrogen fixation protein NifU and related proteins